MPYDQNSPKMSAAQEPAKRYVDFNKLSPELQQEVRDARLLPSMRDPDYPEQASRFMETELALRDRMFWVRKDGHISRTKGHWKLTPKAGARLNREIANMSDPGQLLDPPGKGSLREWKPGVTFSLDRPTR